MYMYEYQYMSKIIMCIFQPTCLLAMSSCIFSFALWVCFCWLAAFTWVLATEWKRSWWYLICHGWIQEIMLHGLALFLCFFWSKRKECLTYPFLDHLGLITLAVGAQERRSESMKGYYSPSPSQSQFVVSTQWYRHDYIGAVWKFTRNHQMGLCKQTLTYLYLLNIAEDP